MFFPVCCCYRVGFSLLVVVWVFCLFVWFGFLLMLAIRSAADNNSLM